MKRSIFGVMTAVFALLVSSCVCVAQPFVVKGNGKVARGSFEIPLDYTSLSVEQGITVVLIPSDVGEGRIVADEEVFEHVSIVETGGRVKISYTPRITVRLSGIETVVTMPISDRLARVDASSAGKVECETLLKAAAMSINASSAARVAFDIEAGALDMELSSAANYRGEITAEAFDVELNSAAGCDVSGRAGFLDVETSSAAGYRGYELVAQEADVDASSGSSVHLTVTEELSARASSGASIRYKGSPRELRPNISSGGSLRNVD